MEDGSIATGAPLVRHLPAQEASRDNNGVVQQGNVVPNTRMVIDMEDSGVATGVPSVRRLPA